MSNVVKFEPRSIGFKPENLQDLETIKEVYAIQVGEAPSTSAIVRSLVSREARRLRTLVGEAHSRIIQENL